MQTKNWFCVKGTGMNMTAKNLFNKRSSGKKVVILGAGIAGISAAYFLEKAGIETAVYEKNASWGGLCDNFTIDGFRFDKFVHLSFTENEAVKKIFEKAGNVFRHKPDASCYYRGLKLKHPVQNNLYPLGIEEKILILEGFFKNNIKKVKDIDNYDQWLRVQYGNDFAERFPIKYTKKYWGTEAKDLETKWIGNRMYRPTISEVLRGALTSKTPNTYYAKEMRYPEKGGFKSFITGMTENLNIRLNKKVVRIKTDIKKIIFSDGSQVEYDILISSLPLPEMKNILVDLPQNIKHAIEQLNWTSGYMVSIGLSNPCESKEIWSYLYDEDTLVSRIYYPCKKSEDNVPKGCSSIQAEIYYSQHRKINLNHQEILQKTIDDLDGMGLINRKHIIVEDIRHEQYANVIFDHEIYKNKSPILEHLDKIGIKSIGRFGLWDYLWSDQSLLSGLDVAKLIINDVNN